MFPWADLATVHVTNGLIRRATPISYPALSWARRLSISHGFKVNRNGPVCKKYNLVFFFHGWRGSLPAVLSRILWHQ